MRYIYPCVYTIIVLVSFVYNTTWQLFHRPNHYFRSTLTLTIPMPESFIGDSMIHQFIDHAVLYSHIQLWQAVCSVPLHNSRDLFFKNMPVHLKRSLKCKKPSLIRNLKSYAHYTFICKIHLSFMLQMLLKKNYISNCILPSKFELSQYCNSSRHRHRKTRLPHHIRLEVKLEWPQTSLDFKAMQTKVKLISL